MEVFKIAGSIFIKSEEAVKKLEEVKEKAKKTGEGFENADDQAKKLSSGGFSVLKGAAADLISSGFQKLISAMGNFVSSGVDYQMQLEQYATAFETLTGSQSVAAAMTERLGEIASNTPFEMPALADTTQLLLNYGFTANEALSKMMMLGDIAQGDADKMNRIASAYGQMSSAGKVSLEDIKQMIEAGFNPLQEISDSTGESMESLYNRISEGTISIDEITASMERSTSEGGKYFGAMQAQSETLTGRLSTLGDAANESVANILAPLLEKAADVWIPKLTSAVEQVDEKFQEFCNWISANSGTLKGLGIVIGIITTALTIQATVQAVKTAMNTAEVASLGALIKVKLADAAATMAALAPYLLIAAVIAAVIAVIVLCVKHWDIIKAKVSEVASAIVAWISQVPGKIAAFASEMYAKAVEFLKQFAKGVYDGFLELVGQIGDWIQENVITPIENKFNDFLNIGRNIINNVWEGMKSAWQNVTSWFSNAWNNLFNKSATVSGNGSGTMTMTPAKTGLDYVPYDEFPALLHEGEAVLTKEEAKVWRAGNGSANNGGSGITIIQNISAVAQTPVQMASATAAYFEQARWAL